MRNMWFVLLILIFSGNCLAADDNLVLKEFSILNGWDAPAPAATKAAAAAPREIKHGGKILGEWISEWEGRPAKITVFTKDEELYLNAFNPKKGQTTLKIRLVKAPKGLQIEAIDGEPKALKHPSYLVDNRNHLQLFRGATMVKDSPQEKALFVHRRVPGQK